MSVTALVSTVVLSAQDLGLQSIARRIQIADMLHRQRYAVVAAMQAAEAVRAAAEHFDAKPIVACAKDLESAARVALTAIDIALEERFSLTAKREPGAFSFEEWHAAGCKPPPMEDGK